jgi:5'-nucleotidase
MLCTRRRRGYTLAMRILLSNDDGILAPGLTALSAAVRDMGELTVCAPSGPQSAAGHAITLHDPLTVRRVRVGGETDGIEGTSVDGRPADCVRLAIRKLMSDWPELVLSGINAGANVGINVFYSGTVAAAAEAAMLGIPAVAFSAKMGPEVNFAAVASVCRTVLDRLLAEPLVRGDLINVNVPDLSPGKPKGVLVVPQSTDELTDIYERTVDEDGTEHYQLGPEYDFVGPTDDTDVPALFDGYVTVTCLHVDMTNHDRLAQLRRMSWPEL